MNFDNIELAAAELRNEPWVTPVSMNADPAVRAYLAAATPTRVHELVQIVKRQAVENARLVLELAAEVQRADMLLEQAKVAAAAVQAEQLRYAALAQELAAAKAAIPAQTGMPQQGGAPDPEWPAGEQEAWRLGYQAAQQGGGELPQDERALAERSADLFGVAYLVNGKYVPPEFVKVVIRDQRAASVPAQARIVSVEQMFGGGTRTVKSYKLATEPDTGRDAALALSLPTCQCFTEQQEQYCIRQRKCAGKATAYNATQAAPEVASVPDAGQAVDAILLSDMVDGAVHPNYGSGLFATANCVTTLYTRPQPAPAVLRIDLEADAWLEKDTTTDSWLFKRSSGFERHLDEFESSFVNAALTAAANK